MDAFKMSWSVFCIMLTFSSVVFVNAQSTEAGACIMTDTSCPCAEILVSGDCITHNGNNKCSKGACKPSYRCDCLGYEMCKRTQCAMYSSEGNVIPGAKDSFPCHPGPSTAVCTSFDYVMDTVAAVENMYTAIIGANDESSAMMMEAYEIVAQIEADIIAVNDALKNIAVLRSRMTAPEKHDIETEAEAVISIVADSGELALNASHEAEKVYRASRQLAELRQEIRKASNSEKTAEQALLTAQQNANDSGESCKQCASLKHELEKNQKTHKEAILKAADISKTSREHNWNAGKLRDQVLENRSRAVEGKRKLLSLIDGINKRVIDVDI